MAGLYFYNTFTGWKRKKTPLITKKIYNYGKEIVLENKKNNSYKLIIKLELNEEEAELLKKRFNLLGLSPKSNDEQSEVIETVLGNFWYKNCEINIIKQYE